MQVGRGRLIRIARRSLDWKGCLLLAAVVSLGVRMASLSDGSLGWAQEGVATSSERNGTFNLAYIPRNAIAVMWLRPASLLEHPVSVPLQESLSRMQQSGLNLGAKPQEIISLRLAILNDSSVAHSAVLAVETETPEAADRFVKARGGGWETQSVAGQEYLRREKGAYFKVNDRTVVFSYDEASVVRCILAGPTGASTTRWAQAWRGTLPAAATAVVNTSLLRTNPPMFAANLLNEFRAKPSGLEGVVAGAETRISALWQRSEYVIAALRIGGDIHVTLLNQSRTEDEAVAVQDALVIVNSAGRTALSEARQLIVSQPEPPNLELLMAIDRLDELLEHLVIARQGAQVHVTAVIEEPLVSILSSGLAQASEVVQKTDTRKTSLANLKQIAQGFQNYHNTYRSFPQAVQIGPKNAPRSWRVTLLPFLGYKELHGEYRQDEPWDSEHNRTILAKMPDVYRCPVDKASSTNSSYFVFIGPEAVFTGNTPRNYAEITDGMANTLLVVECKRDAPWTKPDEIAFDPKQRVPDLGGWYPEGFHAATCAGDTQFFPLDFDETILKYLIMPRDRHPVQMPQAPVPVVPQRSAR